LSQGFLNCENFQRLKSDWNIILVNRPWLRAGLLSSFVQEIIILQNGGSFVGSHDILLLSCAPT